MFFKVITTIAVAVAIFVFAVQTSVPHGEGDGIAIPLTKRSDADARELLVTSHNANISRGPSGVDGSERTTGAHLSAVQRDGSGASLYLTNFGKGIWFGTILIGTPPKPFTVQLNTGFSDLFVPALTGDQNCRSHQNLWDPTSYKTTDLVNMDFMIEFADGRAASGKQYMEPVTIAGFTADSQTIGVATAYSSALKASVFAPDGILGLGFPPLAQLHYESPLLHTLFKEGKLPQPVFSLMLTASGGELYIGGTNTVHYIQSTLFFTPVTNPVLWQLRIDDIQVDGKIVLENVPAIIDTGGNSICGDINRVKILHAAAGGGQYKDSVGYYTFPCKTFPSVSFTVGGNTIAMPREVLNKGRVRPRSTKCFSGILVAHATSRENTLPWSLGTIFLEQLYTVFDFNPQSPRVGFAQLADDGATLFRSPM